MKRIYRALILALTLAGIVVFSAVCWHSVEEIHYLKFFYSQQSSADTHFLRHHPHHG